MSYVLELNLREGAFRSLFVVVAFVVLPLDLSETETQILLLHLNATIYHSQVDLGATIPMNIENGHKAAHVDATRHYLLAPVL